MSSSTRTSHVFLELRERVVEVVVNDDSIMAGYAWRPLVRDWSQLRDRVPGAGDHDPLASLDTREQAGEMGLRFVDVDGLDHAGSMT